MGTYAPRQNEIPCPGARLVRFGADHIFCHRTISAGLYKRVIARLAAKGYPTEVVELIESEHGDRYNGIKVLTYDPEKTRGFDMEREVYRAAQKTHCV
jgi:hypothetical protein